MNIQKLILPAAMSFAGLVSFGAQAATKAGIEIVNTATLNYTVNNVAQTEVKAEKKLQVDVKIDFNLARTNIAAPNASTEIDVAGSKYYVMGKFDLANTTNAPTTFTLKATNGDGTEALGFTGTDYTSLTDTKDPVNSTFKLYSSAAGASAPATELTGNISLNEDGNASNTTALVWVLIPTSEIKGVDKDVFAVQLEAKASEVTVVGEDDSVLVVNDNGKADTDAVQFVFADDAKADGSLEDGAKNKGDAIETALDALFLTFPNFEPDTDYPNDPNKNGFLKESKVIWDPINGAASPKAIPGATVQYTIHLTNLGSITANNVNIADTIPANTTFCDNTDFACFAPKTVVRDGIDAALTYKDPETLPFKDGGEIKATYTTFPAKYTSSITFTVTVN